MHRCCAMFLETSPTIALEVGNQFEIASFYWLLKSNIVRQVERGMLHCACNITKNVLQ